MEYYQQTPEQVIETLKSNPETGLTKSDAQNRFAQYGPNELVEAWQEKSLDDLL